MDGLSLQNGTTVSQIHMNITVDKTRELLYYIWKETQQMLLITKMVPVRECDSINIQDFPANLALHISIPNRHQV